MMKAMIGKTNFSGSWEEDLDTCISVFDTLVTMCQLSVEDNFKSIPIMLTGDALSYFSTHAQSRDKFDEVMNFLRSWYNSDDKKARILSKWKSMRLSTAMEDDPDESKVTILGTMVRTSRVDGAVNLRGSEEQGSSLTGKKQCMDEHGADELIFYAGSVSSCRGSDQTTPKNGGHGAPLYAIRYREAWVTSEI